MAARLAWVLNLDADLELAAGSRYLPTRRVVEAMRPHQAKLASSLLGAEDLLVDESDHPNSAQGLSGRAFCPTPRALSILRRAGAEPEPHPSFDVLRKVNSRAFASGMGATLPKAAFVTDFDSARAMLDDHPVVSDRWRVKRAFGMAGRGHHIVRPRAVSNADLRFVRAGLAEGGVQIEPNVAIECEYAVHGWLASSGSLRLGALVRQRCDVRGAWLSTEPVDAGAIEGIGGQLTAEARGVATALSQAAYFGPFGVDAYTYRDLGGAIHLQPRSEVNARYSMGFAVGFGALEVPFTTG